MGWSSWSFEREERWARYWSLAIGVALIIFGLAEGMLPFVAFGVACFSAGVLANVLAWTRTGSPTRVLAVRLFGVILVLCAVVTYVYSDQVPEGGLALAFIVAPLLLASGLWLFVTGRDHSHLSTDPELEIVATQDGWEFRMGESVVSIARSMIQEQLAIPPTDPRNPTYGLPDDSCVDYVLVNLLPGLSLEELQAPKGLGWLEFGPGELLIPEPLIRRG